MHFQVEMSNLEAMGWEGRCTETRKKGGRLLKSWSPFPEFVRQKEGNRESGFGGDHEWDFLMAKV